MRVRASAFAAWLVLAAATTLASAPAETSRAGVGAVGAGPEPSPPPCAARCASDCAAICARSCEAWTLARLPEGPAADVERAACEADDRTGKCGAASCEARCADARCDAGARAGSRTAATPPEDVRRESSSNDARREGGQGGSGARGGSPGATARTGASDAPRGRSGRTLLSSHDSFDPSLSRFLREPTWAFRPIHLRRQPAERFADWWANGPAGVDAADLDASVAIDNAKVPKVKDAMGRFAYAHGRNDAGQLGVGSAAPLREPVARDDPATFLLELAEVAAGEASALGISRAMDLSVATDGSVVLTPGATHGKVYAWGDGSSGRLGLGDARPRTSPTEVVGVPAPAVRVAAFGGHAAAVTEDGAVYCWGSNAHGQLGRPRRASALRGPGAFAAERKNGGARFSDPLSATARADSATPARVVAGGVSDVRVVDVAVGAAHTVALDETGRMWAWGSNANGQLGRLACAERSHHPTGASRPAPNASETGVAFAHGGFVKNNGTGCEAYGAPEVGTLETPAPLELALRWRPDSRGVDSYSGGRVFDYDLEPVTFSRVAAAAHFTLAVSGVPEASPAHSPQTEPAEAQWTATDEWRADANKDRPPSAVWSRRAAANPRGGVAYSFGWGDVGQLGHGAGFHPAGADAYRVPVPTPIAALEGVDVVHVSASRTHCVAVSRDGRVYTWGSGLYGQLGHGDLKTRFAPKMVEALRHVNVTVAAAGERHTVAVDDMGEVYAWGSNEHGELGLDPPPPLDPTRSPPVAGLRGWTQPPAPPSPPAPPPAPPPPGTETSGGTTGGSEGGGRRRMLGMDTEDDPEGAFDLIFERLRGEADASSDAASANRAKAAFGALVAGVAPAFMPDVLVRAYATEKAESLGASPAEAEAEAERAVEAARRDFGWGFMPGQSGASAGVVERVSTPRLVVGVAQADHVAAGAGFTLVTRRACRPGSRLDNITGACEACEPGYYASDVSQAECAPCPRGRFASGKGASRCEPCAPGTYAESPGSETCATCPKGEFLGFGGATSRSQCVACSPGTFGASAGAARCEPCAPGSYQEAAGQSACDLCPAATFQNVNRSRNALDCLACPSGTFSASEGATRCAECAPGHVAPDPRSSTCARCPLGAFAEGSGNAECSPCPVGTYGVAEAARSADECAMCPPGNYSNALGATACVSCPSGSFAEGFGQTECDACPPGTFGDGVGATSGDAHCQPCPLGQYNPTSGRAKNNTQCVPCAMGTFANETGSTRCLGCPPGTHLNVTGGKRESDCLPCWYGKFSAVFGADNCLECAPGTFMNETGATACYGCDPGFFNPSFGQVNATSCFECPPGSFSDVVGTGNCTLCPEGQYQSRYGQTRCVDCAPGLFLPETNSTDESACRPCGVGTYADRPGMGECLACPPGSYSEKTNAVACDLCEPGTAYPLAGGNSSFQCEPCPPGAVAPVAGMPECDPCPMGRYNEFSKASECTPCEPGNYLPFTGSKNAEDCVPCPTSPLGTYAELEGTAECAPCPPGTYAEETGLVQCTPVEPGTYLPSSGSNSSLDAQLCPAGTFAADPGAEVCTDCLTGSYAEAEGSVRCTPCAPGYFLPIEKATSADQCRVCERGTRSGEGAGQCILCPPGSYGDQIAMAECLMCPPGTFNPDAGAKSFDACADCAVGTHNEFPGRQRCLDCPPGTYGNRTGMPECWKCAPGTFIDFEGAIYPEDCAMCAPGSFAADHGSGVCEPCPLGTFNDLEGRDQCAPCPSRRYGTGLGATSVDDCEYCPRWHFNSTPGSTKVQDCVYDHAGARGGKRVEAMLAAASAAMITALVLVPERTSFDGRRRSFDA